MKNLSDRVVEIVVEGKSKKRVPFEKFMKEKFEGCPIVCLETNPNWQYFILHLPNHKQVACDIKSQVQMRKIVHGYFKGCYCVVERGRETYVSVIHNGGVLRYPELKKDFSYEQIDSLFDDENIEKFTAVLLNKYDVSKKNQHYAPDGLATNNQMCKNKVLRQFMQMASKKHETSKKEK